MKKGGGQRKKQGGNLVSNPFGRFSIKKLPRIYQGLKKGMCFLVCRGICGAKRFRRKGPPLKEKKPRREKT